jgi:hypothetical protein
MHFTSLGYRGHYAWRRLLSPFRWKNCYADVAAAKHDLTIQSFLNNVIVPAIRALECRIVELGQSEVPAACFIRRDTEEILEETKKAFALSVQSIWERQLRNYLRGCGEELRPGEGLGARVEKADWPKLCALFRELRGIGLEDFPSYPDLDTLHRLGNACRHGDGPSAVKLAERHSDWWPTYPPLPPEFGRSEPPKRTVGGMDIPLAAIAGFVGVVAQFWVDATYIYNESIERKDPSLEAVLVRERAARAWCPQMSES